jgi:hypothetical protein
MSLRELRRAACFAVLCGACLLPVAHLFAQAPAGPLPPSHPLPPPPAAPPARKKPEIAPRKTLAGFWKLNEDESDDPRQKFEDARKAKGGSGGGSVGAPGGGAGGPRVGVGYPYPSPYPGGGPNGPYGGPGGGPSSGNDAEYERMREVVRAAFTQDITLMDAEVDSADEHTNRLVFYTDGRKIQKPTDDSRQEVTAHWEGAKLITDERGPQNRKISRTYELSIDGKQLYETWRIEGRRSDSPPVVIRYVYDAAIDEHR